MQNPLPQQKRPHSTVLNFIDQYFTNTPISEISSNVIIDKIHAICLHTPLSLTICQILPVAIEIGMQREQIAQHITKAYKMAKPNEVWDVYQLALKFNEKDIIQSYNVEYVTILNQAIQNNRANPGRSYTSKTPAETTH